MTGTDLVALEKPRREKLRRDEARVKRHFWRKLRRHLGRVPFLRDLLAAYYCALDPATPLRVKAVLMGALAYFVLPVDLVPDFIAGLGFTDDATVLLLALRSVAPHIGNQHRLDADGAIRHLSGEDGASAA